MRVHWLQHVPFEDLGSIAPWLQRAGHDVTVTRLHAGDKPPSPDEYDWLIVMGGPMNIYQQAEFPWLVEEKLCIKRAIKEGKKLLGICLGAQLIADVLQARVYSNEELEIGWHSVKLTAEAINLPLFSGFSRTFDAFHWHGDAFGIPDGCHLAASSKGCPHQAFTRGKNIVGIQFHLETTPDSAKYLIEHCGEELEPGRRYAQMPDEILADPERFVQMNKLMDRLLENLAKAG